MDKFCINTDNHLIFPYSGFIWSKSHKRVIGRKDSEGYVRCAVNGKETRVHRYIYERFHNIKLKDDELINHINNVRDDNRIFNLEIVNNQQNSQYQLIPKNNTSGFKGVYWHKRDKKWAVHIRFNKKNIHLGYFENINDAKNSYNTQAQYLNENFGCKFLLNDQ